MEKEPNKLHHYMKNPDVVVTEEDEDGALVFNPDNDQIRVFNHTGIYIWQLCDGNNDLAGIVSAVSESFDAIPEDKIFKQVENFLDEMVSSGFIGMVK
jgi:hypothetical protein